VGGDRKAWDFVLREHSVERWVIPARSGEVWAPTLEAAIEKAVREAHVRAGVPPLRSLLRRSLPHCSATPSPRADLGLR
jgi:hypothetical protein